MDTKILKIVALVLIAFLFVPIVSISCMDEEYTSVSAMNVGLGLDKKIEFMGEKEEVEFDIYISGVLLVFCTVAGAALLWLDMSSETYDKLKLGVYGLGTLGLIGVPMQVAREIGKDSEMEGYIESSAKLSFYIMLILFGIMVYGLYANMKKNQAGNPPIIEE